MANEQNLKPWPNGVGGNHGGRPKTKPLTEELQRLLEQEAPGGNGQTWAALIARALLLKARSGDVPANAPLANRIEGKALQSVELDGNLSSNSQNGSQRHAGAEPVLHPCPEQVVLDDTSRMRQRMPRTLPSLVETGSAMNTQRC